MKRASSWLRILLLVALLTAPVAADDGPLAYRFTAGEQFELTTVTHAQAPVVGAVTTTMLVKTKVVTANSSGMQVEEDITTQAGNHGSSHMVMGAHVAPDGQVTDITGVDWNDAHQALVAKNAANGLPRLPDAPVTIGFTWQDEKPYYLPRSPVPGIPEVLRVTTTYTVTAISGDARPTVSLAIVAKESPGQKATFNAKGTAAVELATGKPLSTHLEGLAVFKLLISSIKVPLTVDVTGR